MTLHPLTLIGGTFVFKLRLVFEKEPPQRGGSFFGGLVKRRFEDQKMQQSEVCKGWNYRVDIYSLSSDHLLGFPSM